MAGTMEYIIHLCEQGWFFDAFNLWARQGKTSCEDLISFVFTAALPTANQVSSYGKQSVVELQYATFTPSECFGW